VVSADSRIERIAAQHSAKRQFFASHYSGRDARSESSLSNGLYSANRFAKKRLTVTVCNGVTIRRAASEVIDADGTTGSGGAIA